MAVTGNSSCPEGLNSQEIAILAGLLLQTCKHVKGSITQQRSARGQHQNAWGRRLWRSLSRKLVPRIAALPWAGNRMPHGVFEYLLNE